MQGHFTPIKIVAFSPELFGLMQKEFAAVMDMRHHPRQHVSLLAEGFLVYEQNGLEKADQEPSAKTKLSGAETPAESTETKTPGDAAADRIIAAFEGEECLTDADLLKASGLSRKEYVEVRNFLIYTSCELNEMEEEDGSTVYEYAKPRKQAAA